LAQGGTMDINSRLHDSLVLSIAKFLPPVTLSRMSTTSKATKATLRRRLAGVKCIVVWARVFHVQHILRVSDSSSNTTKRQYKHSLQIGRVGDSHLIFFRVWLRRSQLLYHDNPINSEHVWPLWSQEADSTSWTPEYSIFDEGIVHTQEMVKACQQEQENRRNAALAVAREWRLKAGAATPADLAWAWEMDKRLRGDYKAAVTDNDSQGSPEDQEEEGDDADEGDTDDSREWQWEQNTPYGVYRLHGDPACEEDFTYPVLPNRGHTLAWTRMSMHATGRPSFILRLRQLFSSGHMLIREWGDTHMPDDNNNQPYHLRQ
jgi:hypothetical protein